MNGGFVRSLLAHIIHDGSSHCTRCIGKSNGYPAVAKRWTHCNEKEQWVPPSTAAKD
ncbi:hypothetical protein DNFV4_00223 [Nitrospira tepida]|uniref:Uncharacterized protein n=1 Tax=Nitrospira tepida TaxID=2973512 RepID=A0AA86MVK7_9BACT|nr:hypothetical protein DNFV4_00223 [Nitrospira tepida]